ncbi:MAG: ABC transporter permease [Parvibaculaceae bacterium]
MRSPVAATADIRGAASGSHATDAAKSVDEFPGFRLITVLMFGFLYLPIGVLVAFSFNASKTISVWEGFTLDWYRVAAANGDLQRAVVNTLIVGAAATVAAVAAALPAALVIATHSRPRRAGFYGLFLSLPLMLPEIVIAIATLIFFTTIGLDLGIGNVIIAHAVFCIPFALMPIIARLKAMDHRLNEAAYDLYATRLQCFRLITLPLLAPGIVTGAMLAFIVSFDNFIITLMVAGAGGTTLPLYIYGLVKTQMTPELNAISTGVLLLSFGLLTAAFVLTRGRILGVSGMSE